MPKVVWSRERPDFLLRRTIAGVADILYRRQFRAQRHGDTLLFADSISRLTPQRRFWGMVRRDDQVLVTVNPGQYVEVLLAGGAVRFG